MQANIPRSANDDSQGKNIGYGFVGLVVVTSLLGLPFVASTTVDWKQLNPVLLIGTISFSTAIGLHAWRSIGARATAVHFLAATSIGWTAEYLGLHYGFPFFEHYTYHPDLQPTLGSVPLFIVLSWWALSYMPIIYLRSFRTSRDRKRRSSLTLLKSSLCALCLMGADLMLDPLAHSVHAWTWQTPGIYFDIPWGNFAGWFVVGLGIYLCYFRFADEKPRESAKLDAVLVWTNEAMSLLGFVAALIHLGSVVPILCFLLFVGPFWIYWHLENGETAK
ncbi:MAG: carotenoid biosynthesis protein [Planctomycetota bacterium]